jgi:hypothetical protein
MLAQWGLAEESLALSTWAALRGGDCGAPAVDVPRYAAVNRARPPCHSAANHTTGQVSDAGGSPPALSRAAQSRPRLPAFPDRSAIWAASGAAASSVICCVARPFLPYLAFGITQVDGDCTYSPQPSRTTLPARFRRSPQLSQLHHLRASQDPSPNLQKPGAKPTDDTRETASTLAFELGHASRRLPFLR